MRRKKRKKKREKEETQDFKLVGRVHRLWFLEGYCFGFSVYALMSFWCLGAFLLDIFYFFGILLISSIRDLVLSSFQ